MSPPMEGLRYRKQVRPLDIKMTLKKDDRGNLAARVSGADAGFLPRTTTGEYVWKVNNEEVLRSEDAQVALNELNQYVEEGQKLTVSYEDNGKELLKTTHQVTGVSDESLQLSGEDLELYGLKGDAPEAHQEE
jgi:hypothetical protein